MTARLRSRTCGHALARSHVLAQPQIWRGAERNTCQVHHCIIWFIRVEAKKATSCWYVSAYPSVLGLCRRIFFTCFVVLRHGSVFFSYYRRLLTPARGPAGWLAGWLVGWLVGWFVGGLNPQTFCASLFELNFGGALVQVDRRFKGRLKRRIRDP